MGVGADQVEETFHFNLGCSSPGACNFDAEASHQSALCQFPEEGYDCDGVCLDLNTNGICDVEEVEGCATPCACNYNPSANVDDGSCNFDCDWCSDPNACNYDAWSAELCPNGGDFCFYPEEGYDCAGNCLFDGSGTCEFSLEIETEEALNVSGFVHRFYVTSLNPADKISGLYNDQMFCDHCPRRTSNGWVVERISPQPAVDFVYYSNHVTAMRRLAVVQRLCQGRPLACAGPPLAYGPHFYSKYRR